MMKNRIKKTLSLLLAVIMMICVVPFSGVSFALYDDYPEQQEGVLIYKIIDDKAYISGYDSNISGDIVIPETLGGYPVEEIGMSAFSNCDGITGVTFNKNIKYIGYYSFSGCDNLKRITVPNGAEVAIFNSAFSGCTKLTDVSIMNSSCIVSGTAFDGTAWYEAQPDGDVYVGSTYYKYKGEMPENTSITIKNGTESIADYAFDYCDTLTNIVIPDSVRFIRYGAFRKCSGLTSVSIPKNVTEIEKYTFKECTALKSVKLPENLGIINEEAFDGCSSLESIVIPDKVNRIWDYAFHDCTSLKNVKIGNGVEDIWERAFYNCTSLTNVEIGDSLREVRWSAFFGSPNLKSVTLPEKISRIDGSSFGYYWDSEESVTKKVEDFTIYGYSCTVAEKYANDNGFKFISIGTKHNFSDWKTTKKPTYKEPGEKEGTCSFCGATAKALININEIKDAKTGISLIYPDGSFYSEPTFEAEEVVDGTYYDSFKRYKKEYKTKLFDLSTTSFGDVNDKLRSPGWVKIPVPEGFNQEKTAVYIVSWDDTFEKVETVFENGFIYFETDDLSWYIGIADETPLTPDTPDTPDTPSENCSCNCHKTGIANFFFKLLLFFQKIFGQNKTCKCGVSHY